MLGFNSVLAQTQSIKAGPPDDEVIRLRQKLLTEIQNNNFEAAKRIKDTLWNNQPNEGEFITFREYYMILFLTGEFDKLLETYRSKNNKTDFGFRFEPIRDSLKLELKVKKEEILININQFPNPKDRPALRNLLENLQYDKSLPNEWRQYKNTLEPDNLHISRGNEYNWEKQKPVGAFLYLFNDSIIYCENIEYKTRFLAKNRFNYGDKNIFANKVKFYQDKLDFFANIKKAGKPPRFFKRHSSGNINYYKKDYWHTTPSYHTSGYYNPGTGSYTPGYYMPEHTEHRLIQYYNFGFEDIQIATYKNLMRDISHNSGSKYYLDIYKRKNRTENILGIIGTSLMVGGLAFVGSSPGVTAITLLSGLIILSVDVYIIIPRNDKNVELENAIKAYQ